MGLVTLLLGELFNYILNSGFQKTCLKVFLELMCHAHYMPRGGRTSSKNNMKYYISFLGMQFTENKQVNALSIQVCQGINADQCLEHFCAKDRTSLHCQKVREILDMGELTYNARKTM